MSSSVAYCLFLMLWFIVLFVIFFCHGVTALLVVALAKPSITDSWFKATPLCMAFLGKCWETVTDSQMCMELSSFFFFSFLHLMHVEKVCFSPSPALPDTVHLLTTCEHLSSHFSLYFHNTTLTLWYVKAKLSLQIQDEQQMSQLAVARETRASVRGGPQCRMMPK